jgi:muramidase (phage lysozyme)
MIEPNSSKKHFLLQKSAERAAVAAADQLVNDPRVRAMLDLLAYTEGTGSDYGKVVDGLVVASPLHPELLGKRNVRVTDLRRHPNITVQVEQGLRSTAAGRYQFLKPTWDALDMPDFSPASQDVGAVRLMKRRGMIAPLLAGDLNGAVIRGAAEWASLPTEAGGSRYRGQPARTLAQISEVYDAALLEHFRLDASSSAVENSQAVTRERVVT